MKDKRGGQVQESIVDLILIAIIFALFVYSQSMKIDGRGARQEIVESQIAMFLEAGVPGMTFEVAKVYANEDNNDKINSILISDGRVYIEIGGLNSYEGTEYFSAYDVIVEERSGKYVLEIV